MKKLTALGASTIGFLTFAFPALATDPVTINPCPKNAGQNFSVLCNYSLQGGLIQSIITLAFVVAGLIALGFLIYGGVRWILSGGEKEKVEEARGTIVAALVGLVIVFASYILIKLVFGFFNLDFGTFTIPSISAS
jgi:hypothetical protein